MNAIETKTSDYLVRHGAIPDLVSASWQNETALSRGASVVLKTPRGEELGTVLEKYRSTSEPGQESTPTTTVLRLAEEADLAKFRRLQSKAREEYPLWTQRITEWNLDLQLIDMEWILDESRVILYVLNERGPECTKLALQAAAAGLGVIDVQPVSSEGLVIAPAKESGGGCGNCGCH
ncbi:PSP1 C-terminal domain-containing protein [Planctomicrobium sp. SH527]|uniref:PSP1 C-terminal domain-containing protein n=1 Tax=Planctomicrobium sp. SH527 TaxID=3448123 RepID=UPI003F5BBC53